MGSYFQIAGLMFAADKKLLARCLLAVMLILGLESVIPVYMEWMIDQTEIRKSIPFFAGCVAVFIAAYLGLCILNAFRTGLYERLGRYILWETREKIYRVLWGSDYSAFVRDNREKLKFVLSTETFNVYVITTIYTVGIITDLFTVVLFLVLAFFINPMVAVVLLLAILAAFALSFHSGKQRLLDFEKFENAREADTIVNHETVDMTEVIRTNGLMSYYLKRNEESLNRFSDVAMKANKTDAFWMELDRAVHYIVFIMVAGVLILTGSTGGLPADHFPYRRYRRLHC